MKDKKMTDSNRACRNNVAFVTCAYLSYVSYMRRENGLRYVFAELVCTKSLWIASGRSGGHKTQFKHNWVLRRVVYRPMGA